MGAGAGSYPITLSGYRAIALGSLGIDTTPHISKVLIPKTGGRIYYFLDHFPASWGIPVLYETSEENRPSRTKKLSIKRGRRKSAYAQLCHGLETRQILCHIA